MKVSKAKTKKMFQAIGFSAAGKWDNPTLKRRTAALHKNIDPDAELDDPELNDLLHKLVEASENGEEVEFVVSKKSKRAAPDKTDEPEEPTTKKKSGKKSGKKKSGKKTTASKKTTSKKRTSVSGKSEGKDEFDTVLGTPEAQFNKALSKKAQTHKEIVEKAGLPPKPTHYNHLMRLRKAGFVVETTKGRFKAFKIK